MLTAALWTQICSVCACACQRRVHLHKHDINTPSPGRFSWCVKMPAGVSWSRYMRMFGASILSMFAGAQLVHQYYLPDLSIPEVPPKPGELVTELRGYKLREEARVALEEIKNQYKT